MIDIPPGHPRADSLKIREMLVQQFNRGIVVPQGLIAQGRGEAFDYLLGEKTTNHALDSIRASAATLLLAKHCIISVNGNAAALASGDIVNLMREVDADLEVNLFYRTAERELAIKHLLEQAGAERVLIMTNCTSATIPGLRSERRRVDLRGIFSADVVLVPLEDGDRTEALVSMGKKTIAIDLNPLSRTARKATITIVDNIVRALPLLVKEVQKLKAKRKETLRDIVGNYDNNKSLSLCLGHIRKRLKDLAYSSEGMR